MWRIGHLWETGSVRANWPQYTLIKKYSRLDRRPNLVAESVTLFLQMKPEAPRVTTNGLLIGEYDNMRDWG